MFSQQEWQQQVEEIIRDRTRYSPYYLLLGMRVRELHPGESVLELEVGSHHLDERGRVHPGVIFSLADAASGVAAITLVPGGSRRVVTVEMKVRYFAEVASGNLTAYGKAVWKRERLVFADVEIFGEEGTTVASGTATLFLAG